ncbi:hypothetical protein EK21DRAFT_25979, partial [Setomelanomma holmii]
CIKDHKHEHDLTSALMPTRLIKIHTTIDGKIDTRIFETEPNDPVPYLTLSYCWGGDQEYGTTAETFSQSKDHIDLEELSATIRDAITVSVDMGFQYLWVDSLCIIQDNDQDRSHEIAKMPAIYSNAVCNIAAS